MTPQSPTQGETPIDWETRAMRAEAILGSCEECAKFHGFSRPRQNVGEELQPIIRDMGDELKRTRDQLTKAKEMNRVNYDAANAYMEISTQVRGENDRLKSQSAALLLRNAELTKALENAACALEAIPISADSNYYDYRQKCVDHTRSIASAPAPQDGGAKG